MHNLHELEITKDLKTKSLSEILRKNGWQLLGTGKEAFVAEHPKESYVLRIWVKGSRYEHFVEFCRHNQHNTHVPKFSRYVRPIPGTPYVYVRMEKLLPVSLNRLTQNYMPELLYLHLLAKKYNVRALVDHVFDAVADFIYAEGIDIESISDIMGDLWDIWQRIGPPDPSWKQVSQNLISYATHYGLTSWDLHDANFMTRDGNLVITDPFF